MLTTSPSRRGVTVYEHSAAERTRSLLLQVVLVALVVLGGLAVFDTVSEATEPVADTMDQEATQP
jgi:hypothetical protein